MSVLGRIRFPLIVLLAVIFQTTLLSHWRVANVHADLLLVVAVSGGLVAGPETGAISGFVTGLVADIFLQTPMGLAALTFTLVGWAAGASRARLLRTAWWFAPVAVTVGSAAGTLLFAALGELLGQQVLPHDLLRITSLVAAMNGGLALGATPLTRWALVAAAPGDAARAYTK